MSKVKQQSTKQTGGQQQQTIGEFLKKHGREIWSLYPFREKKIVSYYFITKKSYPNVNMPKFGGHLQQPFTDKNADDIQHIMQCPMELESLRAFLSQNCNVTQFDDLTWRDILRHFQRFCDNRKRAVKGADAGDTKKVKWDDKDTNYMANSDAIVQFTKSKCSLSKLSTTLKPNGEIRYMRKPGLGCRVHIGDFRLWAEQKYPKLFIPEKEKQELLDETLSEREQEKSKDKNYIKLANKIAGDDQ